MSQVSSISSESDEGLSQDLVRGQASRKRRVKVSEMSEEEYKKRRERNNEAVRKCRIKSREKSKEMMDKVGSLRAENAILTQKVTILTKELTLLKDMFLTHAAGPKSKAVVSNKLLLANTMAAINDHQYVKLEEVKSELVIDESRVEDLSMNARPGVVLEKGSDDC